MGAVWRGRSQSPHAIQWLSDNGPQYTATATVLYAHELGLVPITTPAYSPESNGLAEAFVGTFKRDYLGDADLRDAETVLANLGGWVDDYNTQAPHSALGMRSPREYRAVTLRAAFDAATASTATPQLPQEARSSSGPLSGYPPKMGWSRPVPAANLSSPPEQRIGEHSSRLSRPAETCFCGSFFCSRSEILACRREEEGAKGRPCARRL
jgi:hypothetical protein